MPVIAADQDNGGPDRQGHERDRRRRAGDADHRSHDLRLGARRRRPAQRQAAAQPQRVAQRAVSTEVGRPNDLALQYTTRNDDIRPGDSRSPGICSSRLTGIYPPTCRSGTVTSVQDAGTDDQKVHVRAARQRAPRAVRRRSSPSRSTATSRPDVNADATAHAAPPGARPVVRARAGARGLADHDLRHERRPDAARRRLRRAAVRLAASARPSGSSPACSSTWRCCRRSGSARWSTSPAATAPAACASCATRRPARRRRSWGRRRHRDRDDRLLAHELPARASTPR